MLKVGYTVGIYCGSSFVLKHKSIGGGKWEQELRHRLPWGGLYRGKFSKWNPARVLKLSRYKGKDGKVKEEKAGRANADNMTPAKAAIFVMS